MKLIAYLLLVLLICCSLMPTVGFTATTGKIAGVVTDSRSNDPLPGVNIVLRGTLLGGASDEDGLYFILNVPPGVYTVEATMIGYKTTVVTEVRVKIDQTTTIDFKLVESSIAGEEVTVIAERPPVEVDLTASKQVISGEMLEMSPVNNVTQAVNIQSGVNVNGGIRGTFGNDVVYFVDGVEMRDAGSNNNYNGVNKSSIQEMEVLTGGYNAEYGRANGAVVNIVTKSTSQNINASVDGYYRPAGIYHFGRNLYSKDNYEWQVMATREYWDPNSTYLDWDGTTKAGNTGGGYFGTLTPDQRLAAWIKWIEARPSAQLDVHDLLYNYDKRSQLQGETTLYGPLTSKIDFMVSARYLHAAPIYPSLLDYNPDWNFLGKLNFNVTNKTKIVASFMHGGYDNTATSRNSYFTSELSNWGATAEANFINAYDSKKLWPWGSPHVSGHKSPEYYRMYSGQLKLTHTFSSTTFAEISLGRRQMSTIEDFSTGDVLPFTWADNLNTDQLIPSNSFFVPQQDETRTADTYQRNHWTDDNYIRVDLTSQAHPMHQLKAGALFSYQFYKSRYQWGWRRHLSTDWIAYPEGSEFHPFEGAFYLQDKFESQGMIINAGLRLDYFGLNKKVSDTIWDPLRIGTLTPGNRGINLVSMDDQYLVKPKIKLALSPRIGISHPVTETSVLHFMYGHFNQRPTWSKIGTNATPWVAYTIDGLTFPDAWKPIATPEDFPSDGTVSYANWDTYSNPALTYEKTIQYEIGWDQRLSDALRIDLTLYYKDGKSLSQVGQTLSGQVMENYGTDYTRLTTLLFPDPNSTGGAAAGRMGNFVIPVNNGYLDSRGIEITADLRVNQNILFNLIYNLAYIYTSKYGYSRVYIDDGSKLGVDRLYGLSNGDNGISGNTNDRWNPANTLKLHGVFSTPIKFGPSIGSFYPVGNWFLTTYTIWTSGTPYTYHAPGDLSTEINNKKWDNRIETNVRLAKRFALYRNLEAELNMSVYNLFNTKYLKLLGGTQLQEYEEQGLLPRNNNTQEVLEWTIYDRNLMPRQFIFGFSLLF